jgi:hypothetical protein
MNKPTEPLRRDIMNVIKHMEAAFLFTLCVAGVASVAVDAIPAAQAHVSAPAVTAKAAATPSNIPVVHVSAKRMTTVEKLRSLADDVLGSRA